MRLFLHWTDLPPAVCGGVVVIGNFDGLHRGHRAVIDHAAAIARREGLPLTLLTFEPHPRVLFQPDQPPFRLTPLRAKVRLAEQLGLQALVALRFDRTLAQRPAEWFVDAVLLGGLKARHVVAGQDFRFGRQRQGSLALVAERGRALGVGVSAVAPQTDAGGQVYSSTLVRQALVAGRPGEAAALLGHWWEIEGRVEPGEQRGRVLGFPTANLGLGDYLRPALGAYAVRAGVDQGLGTIWRDGVANLGRRPTVGGLDERLEVHLFDFSGDLYRRHLRVQLIEFIRPEQRFDNLEALRQAIAGDAAAARRRLAGEAPAGSMVPAQAGARP